MESPTCYKRSSNDKEVEEENVKKAKTCVNRLKDDSGGWMLSYENFPRKDITKRKKEESHFLRLFTSVLNCIISVKRVNEIFVCQSITSIRESYKFESGPFSFSAIDFTKWENICGYIYRYASQGAGFARLRILNAMQGCRAVEEVLKKSDSRIICLGTGPGNDAVGLLSALSELHHPKTLKMTLVDKFKEWSLCIKLAKVFIEEDNLGNASELFRKTNVELFFIQTDLPGDLVSDKKYFEILAEADVIVMSKLVSVLDKSNDKECERMIIKSLYEHAKADVVILLNDSFHKEMWANFHLVYSWGNKKEDVYLSSALAERRFNHNDAVSSVLPINVLIKKDSSENFHNLENIFD